MMKNGEPKTLVVNSEFTKFYIRATNTYYNLLRPEFIKLTKGKPLPLKLRLTFYRSINEKWDFINIAQIVQDQMKKHRWIPDDDVTNLLVYPPSHQPYYKVDNLNPGVLITIL